MGSGHEAGRGERGAPGHQHGFGRAEGRFVPGRFIVEDRDENGLPPAEGDYSPETVTTVPPTRMTVTPRVVRAPLPEPSQILLVDAQTAGALERYPVRFACMWYGPESSRRAPTAS